MLWSLHNDVLIRYDPMDVNAQLIRIVPIWPGLGEQHFDVQLYLNGRSEDYVTYVRRRSLASAVELAEEWLPAGGWE